MKQTTPPTDLERFINIFQGERVKQLSSGLEVRSRNLDYDLHQARDIITKNNLALVARSEGAMASMNAFMVSYSTNQQ